ncbi:MAG: hypothetical protein IKP43_10185 [Bacteroidaceae bacterium]|nr:hypothetical protein [Bacteroidaceae bacterium]
MTDLLTMMSDIGLKDIESEIQSQLQTVENNDNTMKLAVLLSIISEECLKRLDTIDTAPFVSQLQERLLKLHNEYEKRKPQLETHRRLNMEILQQTESANDQLRDLDERIPRLLTKYDEQLKSVITSRDKLQIENVIKS